MYLYNVTVKVEHAIAADWLTWIKTEHIPEIIATGCFTDATIMQLVENTDQEGPTYAVQYRARTLADYERYLAHYAPALRQKGHEKWGNRFIAFRTLMQLVD